MTMLLFDIGAPAGAIGLVAGVGILFIAFALAFVAFRMLRKTVKMAFRMAIVAMILVIGLVGTLAFFYVGSGSGKPVRPAANRQR